MCRLIWIKLPDNKVIDFEGSKCNCVLGTPGEKLNEEFAKWLIQMYEQAREISKTYTPDLVITMF